MSEPDLTPISGESEAAPAATVKIIVPAVEPVKWPRHKEEINAKTGKYEPFKMSLPPPKQWEYRLADGSLYGVVARWDPAGRDKIVIPCVYAEISNKIETATRWAWAGFGQEDGSRPLLGLPELSTNPLATVLIVEGEKARDAAAKYLPAGWVCMTWQGGGKAVAKTDWSPLAGRRVVIWPDKDAPPIDKATGQVVIDPKTKKPKLPPGELTGRDLYLLLGGLGAGVAQIPVYGPSLQMIPNNGWDLADALPQGLNPTEWMERAAAQISMPVARAKLPAAPENSQGAPQGDGWASGGDGGRGTSNESTDAEAEYRALGYSQGDRGQILFHFFAARSGFIISLSSEAVCSRTGIYNLCHNDSYWREHFDLPRDKFEKLPWTHMGTRLIEECYKAGFFKPDNERGRGAWIDDNRVVMHFGQMLFVDNVPVNPSKMRSDYFYPVRQNFFKPTGVEAMTDDEGKALRKIFRFLNWDNPVFAELFGGWIATSPICGALDWLTHLWITGPKESGKTWIANNLGRRCLGGLAIYPLGNSTAAGILGELGRDARPVIFDEAEGKGEEGVKRREMIIEMMRYSSAESSGEVMKGTPGHGVAKFRVRSQYLLASIGVGLREAADMSRTIVCSIKPRSNTESFKQLQAMVSQIPKNMPERLLRRQLQNTRSIRENAETFAKIIALRSGSRRLGDTIGTLMAGDHSLISSAVISDRDAEDRVDDRMAQKKFDEFSQVNETQEDLELFQHISSFTVKAQNQYGVAFDMTLGEIMGIAYDHYSHEKMHRDECIPFLRRIGLLAERRDGVEGFWIARAKTSFATNIMSKSAYPQGWERILLRHPRAVDSGQEQKNFNGFKQRAVWLPYAVLVCEEITPLAPEADAAE